MARRLRFTSGVLVSGLTGWVFGTWQSGKQHVDAENIERQVLNQDSRVAQYTANLQKQGYALELNKPSFFMELHQQYMFTKAVLTRKDRLHPEGPIRLRNPTTGDMALIFHVGSELMSRDHFAAACTTIFDEGLAEAAFPRLPNKIGVTGTLALSPIYRSPPKDGLIVLRAHPTESKGRRSEAAGELVGLTSGKALASGQVVMIEPWWGKYISIFR